MLPNSLFCLCGFFRPVVTYFTNINHYHNQTLLKVARNLENAKSLFKQCISKNKTNVYVEEKKVRNDHYTYWGKHNENPSRFMYKFTFRDISMIPN